ncbi:MAG: hypothetical protein HN368_02330 [Spirochaetales bacterium]|nr:hypothetical protein [Spirochaetales bacterium]
MLKDLPVHWSFPARALDTEPRYRGRLLPVMRTRIGSRRDFLLPRGYACAPHSLLSTEDARSDLEWAISNPWNSGIHDIFPHAEPIITPENPDWLRDSVAALYKDRKADLLLSFQDETARQVFHLLYTKSGLIIPYTSFFAGDHGPDLRKKIAKSYRRFGYAVAIFAEPKGAEAVKELLDNIESCIYHGVNFGTLHENEADSFSMDRQGGTPLLDQSPEYLFHRSDGGYRRIDISAGTRQPHTGRAKSSRQIKTRRRLSLLKTETTLPPPPDQDSTRHTPVKRTLIADMSGTVRLKNDDLTAVFNEGALTDLIFQGKPTLTGIGSESYYIEGNEQIHFSREGAFSFEGSHVHGLRAAASIRGESITRPGSIVYDYFFLEQYVCLFVSITCMYPVFKAGADIESWAILDFPLFSSRRGDPFSIEAKYMNGERYQITLPGSKGSYVLPGNTFNISGAETTLALSYPESDINFTRLLPLSISRKGRTTVLRISPEGFSQKTDPASLSGYSYHTVFALQVQTDGPAKFQPFRSDIYAEIGKPWVKWNN